MMTASSLEIYTKKGFRIKFVVNYCCKLTSKAIYSSSDASLCINKISTAGSELSVFLDGKKSGSCFSPEFWRLIEPANRPGARKIWGLNILFSDADDATKYEKWITAVLENGEPEDVKEFRRQEKISESKSMLDRLYLRRDRAEKQRNLPSEKEARRLMESYNNVANQGGDGYVPHIYSQEEYDAICDAIAHHEEVLRNA